MAEEPVGLTELELGMVGSALRMEERMSDATLERAMLILRAYKPARVEVWEDIPAESLPHGSVCGARLSGTGYTVHQWNDFGLSAAYLEGGQVWSDVMGFDAAKALVGRHRAEFAPRVEKAEWVSEGERLVALGMYPEEALDDAPVLGEWARGVLDAARKYAEACAKNREDSASILSVRSRLGMLAAAALRVTTSEGPRDPECTCASVLPPALLAVGMHTMYCPKFGPKRTVVLKEIAKGMDETDQDE